MEKYAEWNQGHANTHGICCLNVCKPERKLPWMFVSTSNLTLLYAHAIRVTDGSMTI